MRVLAIAAALSCLAVPAAAKAPSCGLLTDSRDDTYFLRPVPEVAHHDPALDIVSADIGSDRTRFTVVIRVADLPDVTSLSPGGVTYELQFGLSASLATFYANMSVETSGSVVTGLGWRHGFDSDSLRGAIGQVDRTRNEIRITAPYAAFAPVVLVLPGRTEFRGIIALSIRGPRAYGAYADDADAKRTYRTGAPSCVKVGA